MALTELIDWLFSNHFQNYPPRPNENKTITLKKEIIGLKANIEKLQPEYEKKSKLFHSQKEVEGLYQNISEWCYLKNFKIFDIYS